MNKLELFMVENSQVTAALITAVCGVFGIFINILINAHFRRQDYKDKNKIKQIENMEIYYLPLCDKSEYIINLIRKINQNGEINLYRILDDEMGASYAQEVKLFKEQLGELAKHFMGGSYKYQDDYKLFKIHRRAKSSIGDLYQYCEKRIKNSVERDLNELIKELEELVYRIRLREVKIMTDNFFCRIKEYFIIWRGYKRK